MSSSTNKIIGIRIAVLRKERDITQARLAELINVTTETVSRLERGVSIPSLQTLENISQALNVSLKELFDFEPRRVKQDSVEKEINRIVTFLRSMKEEEIS